MKKKLLFGLLAIAVVAFASWKISPGIFAKASVKKTAFILNGRCLWDVNNAQYRCQMSIVEECDPATSQLQIQADCTNVTRFTGLCALPPATPGCTPTPGGTQCTVDSDCIYP